MSRGEVDWNGDVAVYRMCIYVVYVNEAYGTSR